MLSEAVLVIFFSGAVNGALYYALYNQIKAEFRQMRSHFGSEQGDSPEESSFDITNSAQLDYFRPDMHERSVSPSQGLIGRELLSADSEVARAVVEAINGGVGPYAGELEFESKENPICKEEPSCEEPDCKEPSCKEPDCKEPSCMEAGRGEVNVKEAIRSEADGVELLCTSPSLDDLEYPSPESPTDLSSSCGSAPAASFANVGTWLWRRDTKESLREKELADKDTDGTS